MGVEVSPAKLLGNKRINPNNAALETSSSNDISPSKTRRYKGEGSGSIHWRTIIKNGKDYPQAYYHYEFWSEAIASVKSSKYIPKRLSRVSSGDGAGEGGSEGDFAGVGGDENSKAELGQTHDISETLTA